MVETIYIMRIENISDSDYEMRKKYGYSLAVIGSKEELDLLFKITNHTCDFVEDEPNGLQSVTVFSGRFYATKTEFIRALTKELREVRRELREG